MRAGSISGLGRERMEMGDEKGQCVELFQYFERLFDVQLMLCLAWQRNRMCRACMDGICLCVCL